MKIQNSLDYEFGQKVKDFVRKSSKEGKSRFRIKRELKLMGVDNKIIYDSIKEFVPKKIDVNPGLIIAPLVAILIILFFQFNFTGLMAFDETRTYENIIGTAFYENSNFNFTPEEKGNLISLEMTGTYYGNERFNIYLDSGERRYLIANSENLKKGMNEISTQRFSVQINRTDEINEMNKLDLNNTRVETIENSVLNDATILNTSIDFEKMCIQTCALKKLNKTSYKIIIEVNNSALFLQSFSYSISGLLENHAPERTEKKEYEIYDGKDVRVDLKNVYRDVDNDKLYFLLKDETSLEKRDYEYEKKNASAKIIGSNLILEDYSVGEYEFEIIVSDLKDEFRDVLKLRIIRDVVYISPRDIILKIKDKYGREIGEFERKENLNNNSIDIIYDKRLGLGSGFSAGGVGINITGLKTKQENTEFIISEISEEKILTPLIVIPDIEFIQGRLSFGDEILGVVSMCENYDNLTSICLFWKNADDKITYENNRSIIEIKTSGVYAIRKIMKNNLVDGEIAILGAIEKKEKIRNGSLIKNISEDVVDVEIYPLNSSVKKVKINGLKLNNSFKLKLEELSEDNYFSPDVKNMFAIDPTNLNFTTAEIEFTAFGTSLLKCADWEFENRNCSGNWSEIISNMNIGELYKTNISYYDPGFAQVVSTCNISSFNPTYNSFTSACVAASNVATNNGVTEDVTYGKNGAGDNRYGGVLVRSVNTSITNCNSVSSVSVCYEWWGTITAATCDVSYDANGGASYTTLTTACPNTTANPGVECRTVTVGETWVCGNFFGSSGTRGNLKAEAAGSAVGVSGTLSFDVMFFNVTYTLLPPPPNVSDVRPVKNSVYNKSTWIQIAANVSENQDTVSKVYANITYPNSTVRRVNLSLVALTKKYNNSFLIPNITRRYNITYFANDSATHTNKSIKSNFTANDPAFAEIVSTCDYESNGAKGSFISACGTANKLDQQYNDNRTLTLSYNDANYAGLRVQSVNTSITNCGSIKSVQVCSSWYTDAADPTDCDVSVDASGGGSYTAASTACPGTHKNPQTICYNVTASETWTCGSFFGSSGTRALAKSELKRTGLGATSAYFDNLNFRVIYATLGPAPIVANLTPVNNSNSRKSTKIEIRADIGANGGTISKVYANVTYSNSTIRRVNLSFTSGNKYNNSFTIPNLTRRYNITFFANNTQGTVNKTKRTGFNSTDAAFTETVSTCDYESNGAKGSFGTSCTAVERQGQQHNDNRTLSLTFNDANYGGVRVQSVNTAVANCTSIKSVEVCNSWYTDATDPTDCDVSVDASGGGSYTAASTACPGTHANPQTTCYNVTTSETWTCGSFFGSSGTRALAKSELKRTGLGAKTLYNDNLYFRVIYLSTISITTDLIAPNNAAKTKNTTVKFTCNATSSVLKNISLWLNDSSGTFKHNKTQPVGTNTTYMANFSVSTLSNEEVYKWNCQANASSATSSAGAFDTANRTITIDRNSPVLIIDRPKNGTNYTFNSSVNLRANVTDFSSLSKIYVNITRPGGGSFPKRNLSIFSGNTYSVTFTSTNVVGKYNVTWFANDSVTNSNKTKRSHFWINVSKPPSVDLSAPVNNYNTSPASRIFSCNASHETGLRNLSLYINNSAGQFVRNLTDTVAGQGIEYSSGFAAVVLKKEGRYNWNCLAISITEKRGWNDVNRTFTVDNSSPSVRTLSPANGTVYTIGTSVVLKANVTDVLSKTVYVNITGPNKINYTLQSASLSSGNEYRKTFTNTNIKGVYNVTWFANDTLAHTNKTARNNFRISSPPTIVLNRPINANKTIFNRYVNLSWNASDVDGDSIIAYDINITSVTAPDFYLRNITSATNYTTAELKTDTEYNWSIRGYDAYGVGSWAAERNFTIPSVININLNRDSVNFTNITHNVANDTGDNNPLPLIVENLGNILLQIKIYASNALFQRASINSTNFRYAANTSEAGSFDSALSTIVYTNVPGIVAGNATKVVRKLNWTNSRDTAEIEIKVTAPGGERSGNKSSTITVVGTTDE